MPAMNDCPPPEILTKYLDRVGEAVSMNVGADDHMFPATGQMDAYLAVGRAALAAIVMPQMAVGAEPKRILDFGCGAGRVMRWLRAAYPQADLTGVELREESLRFVAAEFGATPLKSTPNIADLALSDTYDLVWVGSVVTHISEADATLLLDTLFDSLEPGGVLVFTVHGRRMVENQISGRHRYIEPDRFSRLMAQAVATGYGHAPHVDGGYLGISVTDMGWVSRWCAASVERRLLSFTEMGWVDHQDVVAVTRRPVG